jgi:sn-glycerol 3-phosphate transport system permease protein
MNKNRLHKKSFDFSPYLFLLPALVIFAIFTFWPFLKTFLYSFAITTFEGKPKRFVGLENYLYLFRNEIFLKTLKITLRFAPMICLPTLGTAFFLAALASAKVSKGRAYEVMYSLPMAIASAPASIIFLTLFRPGRVGVMNYLLGTEIRWLLDPRYAIFVVAFVTIWLSVGSSFIFLLVGFRNVPDELLECARLDGAGSLRQFFCIVVPIASPQIFFVVFKDINESFKSFTQIRMLTQGGPTNSTRVLVYSIYQSAMQDGRIETAFAQSIILFLVILFVIIIQFTTEKRLVHYQ